MVVEGTKIRAARLAVKQETAGKKGSQTWLADAIGAHPTSVSDWERGDTQPSTRHLMSIAGALGVTVESLCGSPEVESNGNRFPGAA
jgi:transcriptional regulator with XRE-family HTH domain